MTEKAAPTLKAKYAILILPVAWLLFSIWAVIMVAYPPFGYTPQVQETNASPTISELLNGMVALGVFCNMLYKRYRQISISAEQKSFLAFLLGTFIMAMDKYFLPGNLLFYIGMAFVDIFPITAILVLLQGKPFRS